MDILPKSITIINLEHIQGGSRISQLPASPSEQVGGGGSWGGGMFTWTSLTRSIVDTWDPLWTVRKRDTHDWKHYILAIFLAGNRNQITIMHWSYMLEHHQYTGAAFMRKLAETRNRDG